MSTKMLVPSLFLALASVACGPSLTMQGASVQVASADSIVNCQPIGGVEATAGSQEKAEIMLRNKAGTMNADMIVVSDTVENAGQVMLKGKAYSCPK